MDNDDFDELSDLEVWDLWVQSDEGKAREKIYQTLLDLESDPEVKKSDTCLEFLRLMRAFEPSDPSIESIQDIVDRLNDGFNTLRAKKNAAVRHEQSRKAKAFVLREWALHRAAYNGNKSAFTRDYVKRVRNEFDVVVTEKQMREVWLKNTPPAGKPACLLAGG
ncbi:thioredoxin domain-containing protein [Pulveribacter suum]|uniref:hypothetical protein n=1 Tax=Pulveribacter suum TaxID=2116657 RepID=UPI0013003463|nr:hypothetical protein [Pulveribacter suum]